MAGFAFNVGKSKVGGYYDRVRGNDPATARLVIVPIETAGLESQAVLQDKATLDAAIGAGAATNEQTTMGRKYFTDADLVDSAPDNANDWMLLDTPDITWLATAGNPISGIIVAYDPNSSADTAIIPLIYIDCAMTPDGTNFTAQTTNGIYKAT